MGHAHFEPFGSGPDPDLRERSEFLHLGISHFNTRSNDLEVTTGRAFLNLPASLSHLIGDLFTVIQIEDLV